MKKSHVVSTQDVHNLVVWQTWEKNMTSWKDSECREQQMLLYEEVAILLLGH